jgi:hypothetical protein
MNTVVFLFFSWVGLLNPHPIHLTLSEVKYVQKNHSFEVVHKIFVDDLEKQVELLFKTRGKEINLHLNSPKELVDADVYLQQYVNEFFSLKINGKPFTGKMIGKEYENDAVWIYVEVLQVPKPKQIYLKDEFLLDVHSDQSNLVNFECGQKKGSIRFHRGHEEEKILME